MMRDAAIVPTSDGFSIQGNATFYNVLALRKRGEKILRQCFKGKQSIVVNLSDFKDHNASSFSLLLCWQRLARQNNSNITFIHLPLSMQRMGKMFGLSGIYE